MAEVINQPIEGTEEYPTVEEGFYNTDRRVYPKDLNDLEEREPEEGAMGVVEEPNWSALFSPDAIVMIPLAVMFDLSGLTELIPVVGQVIGIIVDIVAVIFFGSWMTTRSRMRGQSKGGITATGKAVKNVKKITKWTKRMKWLRPLMFIIEFIPIINILPCWTLVVIFELIS